MAVLKREPLDVLGDALERLVRRLADGERLALDRRRAAPSRPPARGARRPGARRASRKRLQPSTCSSDQSMSFSGGPANITKVRAASAPYLPHDVRRARPTLPQRLDILRPSGPLTMPCVTRRLTGSSTVDEPELLHHLGPEAEVEQVHHRVLGAADVDVDRQPALRLAPCRRAPSSSCGER